MQMSLSCRTMPSLDLEVTMEVIDSTADIEASGFLTRRPDEASLFEIDPDSEEDGDENRASLFDQFSAMDGEFSIRNEDDGFETDPVEAGSRRSLETESDLEDGEDIELDLLDDLDPMT